MSGHNKWSKIKHKKAITDSKKSKEFSRFSKLITLESKASSGNLESPGLKKAIERAKAVNMPLTNIDKAVKKGAGKDAVALEEVTYEAYGPGGVAMIIDGLTDNKNRTAPEVKHILSKNGYDLAAPGSATWAFDKKDGEYIANTTVPVSEEDTEKLDKIVEFLEEQEDIDAVYTNAE